VTLRARFGGRMNGKLEPVFGTADPYYFWLERES
jgi:hypothetical protein